MDTNTTDSSKVPERKQSPTHEPAAGAIALNIGVSKPLAFWQGRAKLKLGKVNSIGLAEQARLVLQKEEKKQCEPTLLFLLHG